MIPNNVDCIILGTGLTNSILAAACSRIGKSVLHVDKNNYYGNEWASFTFQQLIDWIKVTKPNDACLQSIPEELVIKSRMFCIDLCPKLMYSNGSMVNLLVKSNVSRYHEFMNNIRILSMIDDEIHVMPCRRSDVFSSPLLSDLIDKRRIMKFVELCLKFDEEQENPETLEIKANATKPITKFLDEKGLKSILKEYIINSIAMVKPEDPTKKACENIKQFMVATERFGGSPFIFPLYGCGEFPQSFCRLSAVFGGVYCLNTHINNVQIGGISQKQTILTPEKQSGDSPASSNSSQGNFLVKFANNDNEVKSDMLIMDYDSALELNLTLVPRAKDKMARAILITKESVSPNSEKLLSFLRIPHSKTNANTVHLLEFNSSVMVCPSDYNIVYLWTKSTCRDPANDLSSTVDRIFSKNPDKIVWKFFYHQLTGAKTTPLIASDEINGFHITSPPCDDIDYSHNIEEAEKIFKRLCPDQEFLPRAPDPDEIIHQDSEQIDQ